MKKLLFTLILISFYTIKSQNIYTIAGNGSPATSGDGGPAINAEINKPYTVGVDNFGNIYIKGTEPIRKINNQGVISTYSPIPSTRQVSDLIFDASNNMYYSTSHQILKVTPSGITTTLAGTSSGGFSGDGGLAVNAKLNNPQGIVFDALGNLYIADINNHRIRKVDASGFFSTFAGNGGGGFSGDGGQAAAAQLNNPRGIDVDAAGNLYIADQFNHRIRKVNTSGIITTIAGTGSSGTTGFNGPAMTAKMNNPFDVKVNAFGDIFVCDLNWIKKINTSGIITAVAGSDSYSFNGDGGPAINGKFNWPYSISFGPPGDLYIADKENSRIRLICFNSCAVGISEWDNSNNNDISIYPNPSNNAIQLNTNANFNSIEIINSLGQLVLKQNFTNSISIENLSSGIYFINLLDNQNKLLATKKIIKE